MGWGGLRHRGPSAGTLGASEDAASEQSQQAGSWHFYTRQSGLLLVDPLATCRVAGQRGLCRPGTPAPASQWQALRGGNRQCPNTSTTTASDTTEPARASVSPCKAGAATAPTPGLRGLNGVTCAERSARARHPWRPVFALRPATSVTREGDNCSFGSTCSVALDEVPLAVTAQRRGDVSVSGGLGARTGRRRLGTSTLPAQVRSPGLNRRPTRAAQPAGGRAVTQVRPPQWSGPPNFFRFICIF